MFKLDEIKIFPNQIISNFIFEFQLFFQIQNIQINQNQNENFIFKITEETDIKISEKEEMNSIENYLENWISSVQKEFPGYDSLVEEIIQTIYFSKTIKTKKAKTNAIIIHGISGVGKTKLIDLITKFSNFNEILQFDGTQVYQSQFGESEKFLKEKFDQSKLKKNSFLIIDHLEVIASTKETKLEKLVLSELCYLLDDVSSNQISNSFTFIIGITNDLNSIDINLRKIGRFEREFEVTVPTPESRKLILKKLLKNEEFDDFETLIHFLTEKTSCRGI